VRRVLDTLGTVAIYALSLLGWFFFWYGLAALLWFIFTLK